MTDLVEVSIRWRGEGDNVKVAGEFNSWEPQDLNKQEDGSWVAKLSLVPGKYMYKFVVDGDWLVNQDMPTVSDDANVKNNLLEVEDGENSGDSDSWEKVSIPETEGGDAGPGGNGSVLQKIAVVERIFSLSGSFEDAVKEVEASNGTLVEEKCFTDVYYDTAEYQMLRKGVWLKKRIGGVDESWQVRAVVNQKLKICDDIDTITKQVETELGETGSIDDIVTRKLQEMTRVTLKLTKWRIGEMEIEIKKEGEVETALIRVVGDIVTALKDLEESANKLKLVSFHLPSLAAKLTGAA